MTSGSAALDELRHDLAAIPDPEVPVLTIADLGVLRSVAIADGRVLVTITPTYSGCPAMHHIEQRIREVLEHHGVEGEVATTHSPAWTTDWMSAEGRAKLRDYGIAPPRSREIAVSLEGRPLECPQCGSANTEKVSEFGSTACKSLHRCRDCLEPFDHFKEL